MSPNATPTPPRPEIAELTWIAAELERVEEARRWLLDRRAFLLAELERPRPPAAPVASTGPAPLAPAMERRRREMSRRTVARLLLAVGGALVVIAAAVVTVANWGGMGAAGRGAVLLAVTALVLAAPWPLARRDLAATAEAVAAIGLALTLADADLGGRLVSGTPAVGLGAAALGCAVLAAAWAAYGRLAPVRGPWLAAIALAQLPLPLAAAATVPGPGPVAFALAVTAGGDLILAAWAARAELAVERLVASLAAAVTWTGAIITAAAEAAPGGAGTRWPTAVFVLAGVIGVLAARVRWIPGKLAAAVAALSGGLVAAGMALPVAPALPGGWQILAYAVSGAAITTAVWWARPLTRPAGPAVRSLAGYLATGGAAVLGVAGLAVTPDAIAGLLYPLTWVSGAWAGPAAPADRVLLVVLPETPVVLGLVALACWLWPTVWRPAVRPPIRSAGRSAAVATTALAVASVPATVSMPYRAALVTFTALAAALLVGGSLLGARPGPAGREAVGTGAETGAGAAAGSGAAAGRGAETGAGPVAGIGAAAGTGPVAGTGAVAGLLVAVSVALGSLTGPAATLTELAALAAISTVAAGIARRGLPLVAATGGALAAVAGLAGAAGLAAGLPAACAAFAVAGVASAAVAAAQLLRGSRPAHALTLELGAVPVLLIALVMASQRTGTVSVLAALVALLAAAAAWLWRGPRRVIALAGAGVMAVPALGSQLGVLVPAAVTPYRLAVRPWRGVPPSPTAVAAGLPLAMVVLVSCGAAAVVAAGAWRGRRGSLDALAIALPLVAAPAVVAGGLGYAITVGALLALTAGLAAWAAVSSSFTPACGAAVAASLALGWALAAPLPTLVVLGSLTAACAACAWRAPLAVVQAGAAATAVLSLCAFGACAALAAGLPAWQAGLAALAGAAVAQAAAAVAQAAAARLAHPRPALSLAIEVAGWAGAVAAAVPGLGELPHASLVLMATGTLCLCVALRPGRRVLFWLGLAQGEAALGAWLVSAGVHAPEPYTVPAAAVLIAAGWRRSRRSSQVSSWVAYGPGLVLLLLPSLVAVWLLPGWIRPLVLGVVAAGIALAGARNRLLAPLLLGGAVAVLDAGHELAPAVQQLAGMLPRWVPIAVIGLILLVVGASYEARLRDLGRLRAALGRMH